MKGVNKVTLVGRVGADPELRGEGERTVASVSLATTEQWKDKNTGEKVEKTEWHRVSFFGRLAEIVSQYVKKGSVLYVEGRLRTRQYEQNGEKRYATDILGNEMQMIGPSNTEAASAAGGSPRGVMGDAGGRRAANPPTNSRSQQRKPPEDEFDDDIPF